MPPEASFGERVHWCGILITLMLVTGISIHEGSAGLAALFAFMLGMAIGTD
jgi:hypothetical protein